MAFAEPLPSRHYITKGGLSALGEGIMADPDQREPASDSSAMRNLARIGGERWDYGPRIKPGDAFDLSRRLREELRDKGIQGFKRGGRVHRTGIYKLHRGERVIPARSRRARRR